LYDIGTGQRNITGNRMILPTPLQNAFRSILGKTDQCTGSANALETFCVSTGLQVIQWREFLKRAIALQSMRDGDSR